ncbi:hypothetical protein ANCCAN_03716 [Ancylostoma caninum]|uniref:Carboxylesterase type B domain-containing protein n=1 Tax=Ancylostoma caninum TaxID=29170 RepID=A0A368H0H1_ANCCA|nr:hypothetical protein ANCCAN_03716 [Ancylostoma caninum]
MQYNICCHLLYLYPYAYLADVEPEEMIDRVCRIDNQTAFAVESNANLKSIYLPKLEKVTSPIVCPVIENPNLSISEEDCLYFNVTTDARINYQGNKDNCQGSKEDSGSSAVEYIFVLLLSLAMY